jgi:hypothetical protein
MQVALPQLILPVIKWLRMFLKKKFKKKEKKGNVPSIAERSNMISLCNKYITITENLEINKVFNWQKKYNCN